MRKKQKHKDIKYYAWLAVNKFETNNLTAYDGIFHQMKSKFGTKPTNQALNAAWRVYRMIVN